MKNIQLGVGDCKIPLTGTNKGIALAEMAIDTAFSRLNCKGGAGVVQLNQHGLADYQGFAKLIGTIFQVCLSKETRAYGGLAFFPIFLRFEKQLHRGD